MSFPVQAQSWSGRASYYSGRGHTASGGHVGSMTAAHRSLPFGTKVRVTNLSNGRSAVVTINDRGPFVRGRIIDVSTGAAGVLGMRHSGVARVRVSTL
ncbi:septal ring lytic transglycosylase RlpA family protein [Rhodoblastus sp.]|uniref:septal ring lytic transglycosylase RlpA family protein n=1 Tax=Rhodoblastus sp. TaxID=1962975 RepID=UPI003F9D6127